MLAFLDVAGAWDPSLALVMGGAIGVALLAFAAVAPPRARLAGRALTGHAPQIDRRLLLGGALFGVGLGHGGCPGPALVLLGAGAAGVGLCRGDAGRDVAGGQAVACSERAFTQPARPDDATLRLVLTRGPDTRHGVL